MTNESNALLVTPEEAARRLAVGRTTVYTLIASGALASVRIGRSRRVAVAALDRFVDQIGSTAVAGCDPGGDRALPGDAAPARHPTPAASPRGPGLVAPR